LCHVVGDESQVIAPGSGRRGIRFAQVARHDDGFAYTRTVAQRGLDLAQFDTEPAYLDLVIDASQKLDRAIRQEARAVARAIETGGRLKVSRLCEPRLAQVRRLPGIRNVTFNL